jgi:hypothetical protein
MNEDGRSLRYNVCTVGTRCVNDSPGVKKTWSEMHTCNPQTSVHVRHILFLTNCTS